MLIITIRTDAPQAEIGLYVDNRKLQYTSWEAHRALAESLHLQLKKLLGQASKTFADIEGIICFEGPGSFTGLRIGLTVANALAYGLGVPIVANKGDSWIENGIQKLLHGADDTIVIPFYGATPYITPPMK